jgi:hypothetical protein
LESYVFYNDGSPVKLWQAASSAAFVDASATLEVTTCYDGTKSCSDGNRGGSDGTVVDSHLELIQLNSTLGVCKVTQSRDIKSTVGNHPHHYPIYHSLAAVPVYPDCGSRQFMLRMLVKHVSGNPVKIDGTTPDGVASFTHAFAINSMYGTAPPVPELIGLREDAARGAVTGAGYVVSSVFHTISTAPAGSVFFQNPSAGNIELPGSPVDFSVSIGGAIVPNVLSLPQRTAAASISALGLTPNVSYATKCINPGEVLIQNPTAGALVAPGSTVRITVDNGTLQSCGLLK